MHVFLVFLLWTLASNAIAQVRLDTTVALPAVEVSAVRGSLAPGQVLSRRTILSRETISASGARTLADALSAVPGAFVRAYGPGGLATLSLRGMGASQTAILLDGLRLTDPQLGQIDLSLVPAALLQQVDVSSGGASVWQGSDAMAGAIYLASRTSSHPAIALEGEIGAFGYRSGRLSASARGLNLHLWRMEETGNFPYTNTAWFPAREVTREGAQRDQTGLTAQLSSGNTSGGVWVTLSERELPGVASTKVDSARQSDAWLRAWAAHRMTSRTSHLHLRAGVHRGRLRYANPSIGVDDTGVTTVVQSEADVLHHRGRTTYAAGATASFAHARHPSLVRTPFERRLAAFTSVDVPLGLLHFAPALRIEHIAHDAESRVIVTPRLGVHRAGATFSIARVYRTPTFNDRYWQPGGNPSLRPETGWTADAGLRFRLRNHPVHFSAFAHRLHNQIVWTPATNGWAPINLQKTLGRGIELSLASPETHRAWGYRAHYAYGRYTDQTPGAATFGKPLRYVPQESGGMAIYRFGKIRPMVDVHYTGRRWITADGSAWLPAYLLVHTRLHAQLSGNTTLSAHLENLFNHRYSVLEGYPMPGRSGRISLQLSF